MVVHASTVAYQQAGNAFAVVISGASGSGKSSLALELMALGARLVSDDQTVLSVERDTVLARAPGPLRGLIEWHGVGLLPATTLPVARVVAWMDMDQTAPTRLPEQAWTTVLGLSMPYLRRPGSGPVAAGLHQYMIGRAWERHGADSA
ncbi:MAG: serine kinase [Alphaproteobacteria bacterium]|jgi:HPr kinase/phosphorylase|nr:serine kinase [Alphaproteobacteria bacterium]